MKSSTAQSDAEFTSERSSRAFHAPAEKGAVGREEVALDLVGWVVVDSVAVATGEAAAVREAKAAATAAEGSDRRCPARCR
jgi:hypothetical protein